MMVVVWWLCDGGGVMLIVVAQKNIWVDNKEAGHGEAKNNGMRNI